MYGMGNWPHCDHFAPKQAANAGIGAARSRETSVWSALPGLPGGSSGQICPASEPAWHDTPGAQGEQSEQNPQLATADVDLAPRLVPHLKRA